MTDFDRDTLDSRLVELINHIEDCCNNDDVSGWLNTMPEIADLCLSLKEMTDDEKYTDILKSVLDSIDEIIIISSKDCTLENKEKYNILRLKMFRIRGRIE